MEKKKPWAGRRAFAVLGAEVEQTKQDPDAGRFLAMIEGIFENESRLKTKVLWALTSNAIKGFDGLPLECGESFFQSIFSRSHMMETKTENSRQKAAMRRKTYSALRTIAEKRMLAFANKERSTQLQLFPATA